MSFFYKHPCFIHIAPLSPCGNRSINITPKLLFISLLKITRAAINSKSALNTSFVV